MSIPTTYSISAAQSSMTYGTCPYCGIGITLSNVNCPRCCAISAVQYIMDSRDWREDKSAVEDHIEHMVLRFESVSFFLYHVSSRLSSMATRTIGDLVNRDEMNCIVYRILLVLSSMDSNCLQVFSRHHRSSCLWIIGSIINIRRQFLQDALICRRPTPSWAA